MSYTRRQALRDGLLFEVDSVIQHASILNGMVCDSAAFTVTMFEDRIKGPKPEGENEYTETVRLIEHFRKVAEQAPEGTETVTFAFDQWKPSYSNGCNPGKTYQSWTKEKWICRVTASIEDGLRCLTFTEHKEDTHGKKSNVDQHEAQEV